jgi:hypothetical protein
VRKKALRRMSSCFRTTLSCRDIREAGKRDPSEPSISHFKQPRLRDLAARIARVLLPTSLL